MNRQEIFVVQKAIAILISIFFFSPGIQAAENFRPAEASHFCYRHKPTDNMLYDCLEVMSPNDAFPTISCYNPGKKAYQSFTPDENWEKIVGCDCQRPSKVNILEVPKGPP